MANPVFPLSSHLCCPVSEAAQVGESFHEEYSCGTPYPHIAIDNFLAPELLESVLEDLRTLPPVERSFDRAQERLKTSYSPELLPERTRNLFWFFNSRPFIAFLEKLTGISGLIGDPYFLGGGIHQVRTGGHLDIHADFNHLSKLNLERRLNVLIYLNKEWERSFGGQFEIWDRDMKGCVKEFDPLFNRCVVFNTDSHSFHGNPKPVAHPDGHSRFSIALYYYTASWDGSRRDHTTQFKARPGTHDRFDWKVRMQEAAEDVVPPVLLRLARKVGRAIAH